MLVFRREVEVYGVYAVYPLDFFKEAPYTLSFSSNAIAYRIHSGVWRGLFFYGYATDFPCDVLPYLDNQLRFLTLAFFQLE